MRLSDFRHVFVDFEFRADDGERPVPVCLVATFDGKVVRVWKDELERMSEPPYPIGPDSLIIAYYASAN